jgi:linoleoyl-CoA desaturase
MSNLKFVDHQKSQFYATVRQRVDSYFKDNNLSKNANALMVFKTFFYVGGALTFYCLIISDSFSLPVTLVFAILMGMFAAFIGFNVGHDAIHGSYSSNPQVNKWLGYIFNMVGANDYVWSITHNIVHHTYTNIPGHDEDIEVAPGLIRLSPVDKLHKIQRYQHYYAFLLYGFAAISWVFRKDYKKFFQKKIGNFDNSNPPKIEVFKLFFFKGVYYFFSLVLPFILLSVTWWQFLIGYLCMQIAKGLVLGLVFQLAHVVEGTDFPMANEDGNIEEAWAVHQMQTTANFARKSFWATFFCGGLNMQVEHHLFTKICHVHYPAISDIVKSTAEEFGVPYIENITFGDALVSHYKMLKMFGKDALEQQKKEQKQLAFA